MYGTIVKTKPAASRLSRGCPNCGRHPGDWFSPRRREYAGRLLHFVWWHGSKIRLSSDTYGDIAHEERLDRYAVDRAVDDLYELGAIDLSVVGDTTTVKLLAGRLP